MTTAESESTRLEYACSLGTLSRSSETLINVSDEETPVQMLAKILGYGMEQSAPERAVLEHPDVQEGMSQALREAQEWEDSL